MNFAVRDLAGTVLRLIFPKLPSWAVTLLMAAFAATVDAVREVEKANDHGSKKPLTGAEKFEVVADNIEAFINQRAGEIPGWTQIHPMRRRKLVGGLIELAVFLADIGDGKLTLSNTRPEGIALTVLRKRGFRRVNGVSINQEA